MRRCDVCGLSLDGYRRDARFCNAACRAEAWRVRRLLAGMPAGRYGTLRARMDAYGRPRRHKRSQERSGA